MSTHNLPRHEDIADKSPAGLSREEKLIWILGDMMNAVENYFGAENPKREGHIYAAACRILDEVMPPVEAERHPFMNTEWDRICLVEREIVEAGYNPATADAIARIAVTALAPVEAERGPPREPSAWIDVLAERKRQIGAEGWTPEHDDQHRQEELARAAACYAVSSSFPGGGYQVWPWDWRWWKPTDRRRDLVKAGALILAEIERLDRSHSAPKAEG